MNFDDTISAISSPRGKGGVAVIRISGSEAFGIADKVFKPKNGKKLSECNQRYFAYGGIFDGENEIDDGLAVRFGAPNSFTGEDTVEINCHGGILISEKVLTAILKNGARYALPGEFTRRAFVNGKMGLSSAEGLSLLLEAKNDGQIKISKSTREGKIKEKIDGIYGNLATVLSSVYAKIDFPDEDLAEMSEDEMKESLKEQLRRIETLIDSYKTGHAVCEGIKTVIVGTPNVGKSTLYNLLVGKESAIVTDIAGTTRDVLEETVSLGKVVLRLCDTAGIRNTDDVIEKIGVDRAKGKLDEAELVFALFDNSRKLSEEDREILDNLTKINKPVIAIINKSDKNSMIEKEELEKVFSTILYISANKEESLGKIADTVEAMYINEEIYEANSAIIINARQNASLVKAKESLQNAISTIENGFSADLSGIDVENAMKNLSELEGREVNEDVVSEIFSHFCVGK